MNGDPRLTPPRIGRQKELNPRPDERTVRLLNPRVIYGARIKGKFLVYLDTNIWIRLAHGATREAEECLAQCRAAKASGRVLFPLSYPLWSELLDQQSSASMRARAQLMDELSDGAGFRDTDEIRRVEAETVFPMMFGEPVREPDPSRLFMFVCDCFGDSYMTFDSTWTEATREAFVSHARAQPELRSLAWQVDHMNLAERRAAHAAQQERRRQQMADAFQRAADHARNPDGSMNLRKALLEEHVAVLKRTVLPAFREIVMRGRSAEAVMGLLEKQKAAIGDGSEGLLEFEDVLVEAIERAMDITCCTQNHAVLIRRRFRFKQ